MKDNKNQIINESKKEELKINGTCPLPIGCKDEKCLNCGSNNLTGAIITETADEQDPNILCLDCGYWRD